MFNEETLQKVLQQIQMQLISSQKELSLTQASIAAKNREKRMLQLTVQDLASVPREEPVKMYEGVGKMFLMQPRSSIDKANVEREKELSNEIDNLTKKAKYQQKLFDDANGQMKDIFHAQQRQQQ